MTLRGKNRQRGKNQSGGLYVYRKRRRQIGGRAAAAALATSMFLPMIGNISKNKKLGF